MLMRYSSRIVANWRTTGTKLRLAGVFGRLIDDLQTDLCTTAASTVDGPSAPFQYAPRLDEQAAGLVGHACSAGRDLDSLESWSGTA
jgi:hypothetical protein